MGIRIIRRPIAYIFALLFVASAVVSLYPGSAEALSGSQFQAGRIIDDSVFYNENKMTPTSIQAFLRAKVPVCDTNGTGSYGGTTRAAYGTSQGYPPPYRCLKDYTKNVPARGGDKYCKAMSGGTKSAARIIYDVAQACGINPQIFLILLQKEQGLVTDDWPWTKQYKKATGFGCPDTAPCDPAYAGFFNQVHQAGRGFKRYTIDQADYNYRAQRNNLIYWHPNDACGRSNVFIQNRATAVLYIYTPYRPNQAALDSLYGTGNSCSSYGNRNFWRMFWDWFGNPHTTTAYSWGLESQEVFANSGRTTPITSPFGIQPGETIYLRIKARNMGNKAWNKTFMNLGTSRPRDRTSPFHDGSWPSNFRAANLKEDSVSPGGVGTFEFTMTAPSTKGSYREYFNLVADGKTWLNDIGMYIPIDVTDTVTASNATNISLESGESLGLGDYLLSPDTHSTLQLQTDGNLVLYKDFQVIWHTGTGGKSTHRLVMQGDGNLVLYSKTSQVLWHSGTYANPGARLALQADGNLAIYDGGPALWHTDTVNNPRHLSHVVTTLSKKQFMVPGQSLETADRRFKLLFQTDGNLVIYSPNRATWSTHTAGKSAGFVSMQNDGNLVMYSKAGKVLWRSGTGGKDGTNLVMQPDGNLVLYTVNGKPVWHTQTNGEE